MMEIDYFADAESVSLEEMLAAREYRVCIQQTILQEYKKPLISFTLNIPGEYKIYPLVFQAFEEGKQAIECLLNRKTILSARVESFVKKTGCEAFYWADYPATDLKQLMLSVEEYHPLGRFFDIDVLDADGTPLHGVECGRKERPCFICGKPVWKCSRSRTHSADTLAIHTASQLRDYFAGQYAGKIGQFAVRALLYEVSVTPKPGLVDRGNSGSHTDMDFFTFIDSGCSLISYFQDVTRVSILFDGKPEHLLERIRPLGIAAEETMFAHAGGVNTHKGLIYSMGIVCAALGYLRQSGDEVQAESIFNMCARIAGTALNEFKVSEQQAKTNGELVYEQYKIPGIRGEVLQGFPNVRDYSLPVMERMVKQGCSLNDAGIIALLHLIAHVDDTNIIHRSNLQRAEQIKSQLREHLEIESDEANLVKLSEALDTEFIAERLSPGGCADLLAITFLIYFVLQ